MRKIILLCTDRGQQDLYQLQWEGRFEVEVTPSESEVDLVRKLNQSSDSIAVIVDLEIDWNKCLNDYFKNNNNVSLIVVGNKPHEVEAVFVSLYAQNWNEIFKQFDINPANPDSLYSKIRPYQFLQLGQTLCDLYLKIGEQKYVKIINKGEIFTKDILDHYRDKNIKFLYIKYEEMKNYIEELGKTVLMQLDFEINNDELKKEIQLAGIDTLHKNLTMIGLNSLTIELTLKTVNSVINNLKNVKTVWDYIQTKMSNGNFLSEHSLATAVLCSSMADEMNWTSDYIKRKLVMCSILHDIALADENLSLIQDQNDINFKNLPEKNKKEFLEHPKAAIDIIKQLKDVPANVETVVMEHHERPDGSGFPFGLGAQNITPLSCIMIIAEEFYQKLHRYGFGIEARNKVLQEMSVEYNKGNFRAPLNSLINLFI